MGRQNRLRVAQLSRLSTRPGGFVSDEGKVDLMKKGSVRRVALAAALTVAIGALTGGAARAEHDPASPAQAQIEETIHQYLVEHPEVMLEVLEILRGRNKAAEAEQTRAGLAAYRDSLVNDPTSPVFGNPDGDVTLVEFFDYQCPYCKRVMPDVITVLDEDPGLRIVYKEFPILGPVSVVAARAALASLNQDPAKYSAFHNALMSTRGRLTEIRIMQVAGDIGFDVERLKADMATPEIEEMIQSNLVLARALGITATPTFVIGDQLIPGAISLDDLKKLIAAARAS